VTGDGLQQPVAGQKFVFDPGNNDAEQRKLNKLIHWFPLSPGLRVSKY
jgi:hypothetical protein